MTSLQRQSGESVTARRTLDAVRQFRENLRKEVLAWEGGADVHRASVEELNRLMAAHPMLSKVQATGNVPSMELWFEPRQPEDLFAPLAHTAAKLFAEADRNRVRMCGQCVLHFYDTSKKGTRRWCSMQLCGNRLKVAAYAARQRLQ
jgi:predicted RNA-binding Zn ribbon-like protein